MSTQVKSDHLYYGLLALVILAPIIFFPSLVNLYRLPKATFISVFVTGLLWLWLFLLFQEREERVVLPLAIPVIFYLGLSTLSLINAINLFEGIFALFQKVTYVFLFWLVINQARTIETVKSILRCAIFSAFIVSLLGIFQMFGGEIPGLVNLASPGSTFGNKNMAAQFILLILALPYMFLLLTTERQKEMLFGITAAVVSTYLLYTGTRAAWAGGIISSLTLLMLFRLKLSKADFEKLKGVVARKRLLLLGIMIFVLAMNSIPPYVVPDWRVAGAPSPVSRFATIAEIDQDTSFLNRLAMSANTFEMFKRHPLLGVGKGNFKIVYPLYAEKRIKDINYSSEVQPREAHNDYIQLLGETGIFAFASFLWILVLIALRVWTSIPGKGDQNWIALIFTLAFSIVAILVEASLDFPFELPVSEAFFWLFAGLLWISCQNNSPAANSNASPWEAAGPWGWRPGARSGRLAVGFLSALSILATAVHLTFLRAEFHFSQGVRLAREDALELAVQEIRRAEFFNPTTHRYPFLRGLISLDMKRYPEAIEANLRTLRLHPNYINAYTNLGVAYASAGKIQEAEKAWRKALDIWPDHNDARNNLATTYGLQGRKKEAIALFRESLQRNPSDEKAKQKLATLLRESNQTQP